MAQPFGNRSIASLRNLGYIFSNGSMFSFVKVDQEMGSLYDIPLYLWMVKGRPGNLPQDDFLRGLGN
ncbi:hypothetical protein ES703_53550 [subsurface metagenome]